MEFYHIDTSISENYRSKLRSIGVLSGMKTTDLINKIKRIPGFCRDELSIQTKTLIGFINNNTKAYSNININNITIYSLLNNKLLGVINFSIETNNIHINALCVPGINSRLGVGKKLIT